MLGTSTEPRFYGLLYRTVTGEVINDFPLAKVPNWLQQVNADGSWSVQTQIGAQGGFSREELWSYTDAWRYSVAVCYGTGARPGDYICQAGPLLADQLMSEQPPLLQLGGVGLWGLLRMTMQILAGWVPGSGFGVGADILYTTLSLPNIAVNILTNAFGGGGRNPMPIDIPAATFSGDPNAIPTTIQYFGYDLASAGQRLQELTQMQYGPDILLKPYFSDANHVRHLTQIGNPKLITVGNPPYFDYPGEIISILPTRDGSNLSTLTLEKGNGTEYATPLAFASDPTLTAAGWPILEVANTSHADVVRPDVLQNWANSDQALHGRTQSTWQVTMMANNADAPLGSFDPGGQAQYNVQDHCRLRDGLYTQRVLGFQSSPKIDQYMHILQASETT